MTTARTESDEPPPLARKMIEHQRATVEQDFFIWEHMKVLHTPSFAPEEAKYYAAIRRWAKQFYPDLAPLADEAASNGHVSGEAAR
jgi:hypothetical protein